MKAQRLLALAVCGLFSFMLVSQADDLPSKTGIPAPGQIRDDAALKEQLIARQFAQFEQDLHKLILKLKRSSKEGDKERAEVLEKVLEKAKTDLIGVQFEQLITKLKDQGVNSTGDIKLAAESSAKIADQLRSLIALWKEDPRQLKLKDEIARLKDLIKELDKAIHDQKITQAITDTKKTDTNELSKIQKKNTEQVATLIKKMDGKGGKGEPKDSKGEPKPGGKGGEKPAETKSAKAGQGEPKPGDPKKGEAKAGQGKPGEPKPGGDPGEKKPDDGAQKPQPPQGPKDEIANAKKKVKEGNYNQESAEEKIKKKDNPEASNEQEKAIKNFEDAKKKLEDLLRQLREEELERTLADLLRRCERMLAMQISVYNGTKGVFAAVEKNVSKDATLERENKQASLKLSDQEGEIVNEARKAIEVLEAEGSAVAFPEVFQQVRDDMTHVQRRLGVADVGTVTQTIEQDIIDSLKEMIEALKKAQQDMKDKKNNPPPPGSSPPQDSKLLELIQELKLIRSLQIRVNTRTTTYGRMYQGKGEQASDPNIRREIIDLSARQERIFEVTNRLAKGDNK